MKKIMLLILILYSFNCFSQADSIQIKISVTLTYKELNYLGSFIFNNDDVFGDFYDSVKVKYRGVADQTEATSVTISNQSIGTWLYIVDILRNDVVAVGNNVLKKVTDALNLLSTQSYLLRKIAEGDATDLIRYQSIKAFGKQKNKRT